MIRYRIARDSVMLRAKLMTLYSPVAIVWPGLKTTKGWHATREVNAFIKRSLFPFPVRQKRKKNSSDSMLIST